MSLTLTTVDARRLLLAGCALLHNPKKPPTTLGIVRSLGFLQLDSINSVERAHELILHTRSDTYRRGDVFKLLRSRKLFEHWTHDASLIPADLYPHWHARFNEFRSRGWHLKRLGPDADAVITAVLARIRTEGPLLSRDFEHPARTGKTAAGGGGWWNWKPAKAALEHLWRTGQLAVSDRIHFQKVYDLPERTFPHLLERPTPTPEQHTDFLCREALSRLGIATPAEIAQFFDLIPIARARQWVHTGLREGRLIPVTVEGRTSVAFHDLRRRLARLPEPGEDLRLLAPFDPLIRDRARTQRLFNFHYRFEAFTPASKRIHGYYVLPVLHHDRLIARVDARFDRSASTLECRVTEWQPGIRPGPRVRSQLREAATRLQHFIGADRLSLTLR